MSSLALANINEDIEDICHKPKRNATGLSDPGHLLTLPNQPSTADPSKQIFNPEFNKQFQEKLASAVLETLQNSGYGN